MAVVIKSKVAELDWHIKLSGEYVMTDSDRQFIEYLNPTFFFNDISGEEWAFTEKLPSGCWLDNIFVEYNPTIHIKATISK